MVSRLSGFFDAARANARGADANALMRACHYGAHGLQIRVPAAPARIVGVAHHVAVAGTFAAEFTLQCHGSSTSNLLKLQTLYCSRPRFAHKEPSNRVVGGRLRRFQTAQPFIR